MIQTIRNSKGNHSMGVPLDKGLGANSSFSSRAVVEEEEEVEVEGSNSRVVEAEEDSNFLEGLAFECELVSVCIGRSLRRSDRVGKSVPCTTWVGSVGS